MATLKGKDLLVSVGTTVCGYATNCQLSITKDTKDIASTSWKQMNQAGAGSWKEYDADKKSWTVSSDNLSGADMADFDAMFAAFNSNEEITIKFGMVTYAASETDNQTATFGTSYTGKGIITSLEMSAPEEGEATYSIQIQGTGELKKA